MAKGRLHHLRLCARHDRPGATVRQCRHFCWSRELQAEWGEMVELWIWVCLVFQYCTVSQQNHASGYMRNVQSHVSALF